MTLAKLITIKDTSGEMHWLNADQIISLTVSDSGTTQIKLADGRQISTTKRASTINQELKQAPS